MLSSSKNGLIELSYNTACERLKCGRTSFQKGIDKLADLGLLRISRSVRRSKIGNLFLLTFLPDCLGNMPVSDYKNLILPKFNPKKYCDYNDRQSAALRHRIQVRSMFEDDTSKCIRDLRRVGKLHTKRVNKKQARKNKVWRKLK